MNKDLKLENGIPKPENSLFNRKTHEQGFETRKDISVTGKLLSQPEKNNPKPKKIFMKPETCNLNWKRT